MKTDKIDILLENSPEENFMFHFFGLASSLLLSFSLLQRRPYVSIIGYYMIAFHNFSIYIECQTVKNVKTVPTITHSLCVNFKSGSLYSCQLLEIHKGCGYTIFFE